MLCRMVHLTHLTLKIVQKPVEAIVAATTLQELDITGNIAYQALNGLLATLTGLTSLALHRIAPCRAPDFTGPDLLQLPDATSGLRYNLAHWLTIASWATSSSKHSGGERRAEMASRL